MQRNVVLGACLVLAFPLFGATTNLIQNGSFETNGGPNSNVLQGWSIVDEAGGSGTWVAQTGATGPVTSSCGPDDVDPPPDGSFAAMTTQAAQGSHALYQDVTIPAGATAVLSFQFFIRSVASLVAARDLSFQSGPNQQFRADIIDPSANPFTVDVLQNILLIADGNPRRSGYASHSVVLNGFGGRTIRLRFTEVDNQGCFYAGVDNVRLETGAVLPPPAIVRFTAVPSLIRFGAATTLSWATQNATSVEIDNGIGAVPASGSRSVSLQQAASFTLTATGPAGTAQRSVGIAVSAPGPSISFSASPSFIEKGKPATLTWSTTEADTVSIDGDIGAVATSGSLNVTPDRTTEYTLTATGSGLTSTARATVFVDPGDVPIVSVTSFPGGIVQVAGPVTAVDRYALTNLGRVGTTIQLAQSGDFFTQSPSSFALAPGATQIVTITMTARAAGNYRGTSTPSGNGVAPGLEVPVRLFLAVAPTGTVAPTTAVARTEVAAPANENPSGSVSFTNAGTGTLQGIVTSDVAWLIPQPDLVVIGPGETKEVTFTTNRALRPDAASLAGAAVGTLTLSYVDFARGSSLIAHDTSPSPTTISVTVVDVVKASVVPATPAPLAAGEVAFFVPGLAKLPKTSGDLIVSIIGNSISDLKLFLGTPGASPVLGSLDQIAPNAGLVIPSILQSLFASSAAIGTVQARSANLARVSLAGLQTLTASSFATFLTSLPAFRSDRSAGAGDILYLPGVDKSSSRRTNLVVQEVTGLAAKVKIDFLSAAGSVVSARSEDTLAAFAILSLLDVVPQGTAAVRITNTSSSAARIVAYATVVDTATNDGWTIVDSQSLATPSNEQIVAVIPPPAKSGTATNELFVLNPSAGPVEVTLENRANASRRRSAKSQSLTETATTMTVAAGQTLSIPILFSSGFVRVTAPQRLILSARSVQSFPGLGAFGSALPATPVTAALTAGQSRRFGGVDDSSRATTELATPLTYRSNLELIETSGQAAVVRLTLRYTFSAGSKVSAQGLSTANVEVPANRLLVLSEIARAIIGASRDSLGDLRNMQLDVDVLSGGRVLPFVQTIDNGSGDSAIRAQ